MKANQDFKIYGVFGYPLGHTLSPVMHEAALATIGAKAFYLALELNKKRFIASVRGLRHSPLDGFNITVPYKEVVLPHLDRVSRTSRALGAVNTVYRQGKKWIGENTDVDGFLTSLTKQAGFRVRGTKVFVLGAGGAARAVVYGLAKRGAASIVVANRHPARAKALVRAFKGLFPKVILEARTLSNKTIRDGVEASDLIVNSTSLGMKRSDREIIPLRMIPRAVKKRRSLFVDLVYKPSETRFLLNASKRGHATLSGFWMLLYQGALAFEIWTGRKAPLKVMEKALKGALEVKVSRRK